MTTESPRRCRLCGSIQHTRDNCPMNGSRRCRFCGKYHSEQACPKITGIPTPVATHYLINR